MSNTSLAKKLRLQPGQRIMILNPPPGYFEILGDLPENVEVVVEPTQDADFVHLFVKALKSWKNALHQ